MDDLTAVVRTAASAMKAQSERMRLISENLANADSVSTPGEESYRRKVATFGTMVDQASGANLVAVTDVSEDTSPLPLEYDPSHPKANAEGYIQRPNIEPLVEMANAERLHAPMKPA